jgi:hypothetical protein
VSVGHEEIPDVDHESVIARVCAIDVAKASGKVCVRIPHATLEDRRVSRVWDVPATFTSVTELATELVAEKIERVTVESTSDYVRHEGA